MKHGGLLIFLFSPTLEAERSTVWTYPPESELRMKRACAIVIGLEHLVRAESRKCVIFNRERGGF